MRASLAVRQVHGPAFDLQIGKLCLSHYQRLKSECRIPACPHFYGRTVDHLEDLPYGEWAGIEPPIKLRGTPRANDRHVPRCHLLGLAIWSTLARSAKAFGPNTAGQNGLVRWRKTGVWRRIIDAVSAAHDTAVQMIAPRLPACIGKGHASPKTI